MTLTAADTDTTTALGAALSRALDGDFAEARAAARASVPTERLHRDRPSWTSRTARQWTLDRIVELNGSGFVSGGHSPLGRGSR